MPSVTIRILEGRSKEKLRRVMDKITEVMCNELAYDKKHISIYIDEVAHDAFMENGETGTELIARFGVAHKYQGN